MHTNILPCISNNVKLLAIEGLEAINKDLPSHNGSHDFLSNKLLLLSFSCVSMFWFPIVLLFAGTAVLHYLSVSLIQNEKLKKVLESTFKHPLGVAHRIFAVSAKWSACNGVELPFVQGQNFFLRSASVGMPLHFYCFCCYLRKLWNKCCSEDNTKDFGSPTLLI